MARKRVRRWTAEDLVLTHAGVFDRRHQIILALCASALSRDDLDPRDAGKWIVDVANTIIEETEQRA